MEALRKLVNVIVLLFLVYTLLVFLNVISTEYLDSTFTSFSPENYYKTAFGIGSVLLLIFLLVSNMSMLALKRERTLLNNRINELKAELYDRRAEGTRDLTSQTRPATNPISKPDPIFPPDNLQ